MINLFPFLPLDGGHIFWALAEKVRGKAIPFSVMERAGFVGFALVIMLFLVGLTNDIERIANGASDSGSVRPWRSSRAVGAATIAEAFRLTVEDHPDRLAVRARGRRDLDVGAAARPRRTPSRAALRQARRQARRHRRADDLQPPGVHDRRPGGDDARRDAVLDLPHVARPTRSPT